MEAHVKQIKIVKVDFVQLILIFVQQWNQEDKDNFVIRKIIVKMDFTVIIKTHVKSKKIIADVVIKIFNV